MGKVNRHGQAAVLGAKEWGKLDKLCHSMMHRCIIALLKYTGERVGAILQLRIEDVYTDPMRKILKPEITYRAATRKGKDKTRQVPIKSELSAVLKLYSPPASGWLFPSPRNPEQPISYEAVLKYLKSRSLEAGLAGVSTHSGRRSFITHMARNSVDIHTIQQITGHANLTNLQRYIDNDPERVKRTLEHFTYV